MSIKKKVALYCVIAALFAGSLAAWFFIKSISAENPAAEIYRNGELVHTLDLSVEQSILIEDGGKYNVVTVSNGAVGVTDASCPDKICVNTGFISDGIIPVICLPNRLEIRVVSSDGENKLDAVAR